ncbi:hypothetical protein D187_007988 [Cystobacter fuscus DSM 2262]|uniref:Uncharacterized protein n=1 Tax=Cystobacter fuscus (strain ATCC 25194 / DSM 2262 / NBRC 100088 / M29) TaxID=1242864 RepID=S9P0N3_CYSF2|nr:hypothetical protein [Cystobacter fuscus]EPX56646.1 hypothetical protein D187_007988 [Cystobacter fuscus DSM 2262]
MRVLLTLLLLALPGLAGAEPLPVTLLPSEVVLGRDPVVVVRVKAPPGAPPLRAAASTGRLTPQRSSTPEEFLFIWTPPDIRYPLLAVLAFWTDSPAGPPEITRVPIPLLGRNELTVDTAAGAQVVVEVAGRSFGPARADRRGKAKVTVQVPPGVSKASVRVTSTRQRPSLRTIPLDVPPEQPLLAVMSPESLPAGGDGWLVLMGEQPVPGSELRLRVKGASTREELPSVFRVKPEPGANAVVVEAQRADGTGSTRLTTHVVAAVVRFTPAPAPPALVVPLARVTPALVLGPVVAPPPRPPPPPAHPFSVQVLAGGFLAGGDNRGPLASLGVGYQLPLLDGRFALEAEAGLRRSTSHALVEGLGTVDSRVLASPLLLSVRGRAFELGRFSLHGRVGAGPTYYNHRATSSFFDTPLVQQGRTFMGFVAAQAVWRLGAVSTLLEVRAGRAAASASLVDAQLGGLSACVGLRYRL